MTTKKFYKVTICLWEGSQFDEDEDAKYYANHDTADAAFDTSVKDMYHYFEVWYDSEFILVNEEKLIDGTRVCTITGHNAADETDTCKVKLEELEMIIDEDSINGDELTTVADQMRKEWDEFVKEHGHDPKFAHTVTKYGDEEPAMDVIKVSGFDKEDTGNDPDDNYVMFYADGINELCQINTDGIADFIITDFHGFSDEI